MYAITQTAPARTAPLAWTPVPLPEHAEARPIPRELFNAPSPLEVEGSSRTLMEAIEEGDAALRRHMALPPGTALPCRCSEQPATLVQALALELDCNLPERTRTARALIAALEPLRQQLARRVAEDLQRWQEGKKTASTSNPELLRYEVLYATLMEVLRWLRLADLSYRQRLRIAEVLQVAGGHPDTLCGWLGIKHGALKDDYRNALLNLMLPERGSLGLDRPYSAALREERAHIWQWVSMVNRRFGHPDDQLAVHRPLAPQAAPGADRRISQLRNLATTPEAHREGINVQLP